VPPQTPNGPAYRGESTAIDDAARGVASHRDPGSEAAEVEQVCPYAVNVISGVEASRTVKSPESVREFIRQAKALNSGTKR
jgi:hypothetical protein